MCTETLCITAFFDGEKKMGHKDTIGYKIRLIHNQVHKTMEAKRMANEGNLTGVQSWAIGFLYKNMERDIYQKDIEAEFSISRATASNMLAVMERKGLIVRAAVEHDARLKKIVLTEKAKQIVTKANEDMHEMEERLIRGMSAQDIEAFHRLLNQVMGNICVDGDDIPQDIVPKEESKL